MQLETLRKIVIDALEDVKAQKIAILDVRGLSNVTDLMIVASGTSTRQVSAIAENVATEAREAGRPPLGVEGVADGEWALVDLGDIVVHVMLPMVRELYQLERLWENPTEATPVRVAQG